MSAVVAQRIVELSPRGQITLPADVRKLVGFKSGDTLMVRVEDGRVVVEAAMVMPVERYTDKRISEFAENAKLTAKELVKARKAWGL